MNLSQLYFASHMVSVPDQSFCGDFKPSMFLPALYLVSFLGHSATIGTADFTAELSPPQTEPNKHKQGPGLDKETHLNPDKP